MAYSRKLSNMNQKHRDHDIETKGQAPEVYIAEQHANMARLRGEKELLVAASNIQTEYKKRLDETKDLAMRLEKQLGAVRAELASATACRQQIVAMLGKVHCPLQLNVAWLAARKGRPQSASAEGISRALTQSSYDLRSAVDSLSTELVEVDAAIADLRRSETRFLEELRSKAATMVLDRACMDGQPLSEAIVPKPPARLSPAAPVSARAVGGARSLESPMSQATTTGGTPRRALMQAHGLHTENEWRNQTHASLSAGVGAIEASKKTRKRATATMKGVEESGKTVRPACVVDALQAHMKYETQQISALKYNARMVSGEIATLEKHAATVLATLERVRTQMANAQSRLDLQAVRPASEANRTGVEEVLEVEVINMKRTEQTLVTQLRELETKKLRQVQLRSKIDAETATRGDSLALDTKCSQLPLPQLPQLGDRFTHRSQQQHAGSPRGADAPARPSPRSVHVAPSPRR